MSSERGRIPYEITQLHIAEGEGMPYLKPGEDPAIEREWRFIKKNEALDVDLLSVATSEGMPDLRPDPS